MWKLQEFFKDEDIFKAVVTEWNGLLLHVGIIIKVISLNPEQVFSLPESKWCNRLSSFNIHRFYSTHCFCKTCPFRNNKMKQMGSFEVFEVINCDFSCHQAFKDMLYAAQDQAPSMEGKKTQCLDKQNPDRRTETHSDSLMFSAVPCLGIPRITTLH